MCNLWHQTQQTTHVDDATDNDDDDVSYLLDSCHIYNCVVCSCVVCGCVVCGCGLWFVEVCGL